MAIRTMKSGAYVCATASILVALAAPSEAVIKCKAKTSKTDGTINVSASGVTGNLLWGNTLGSESNPFFDAATCIADGSATKCALADVGNPQRSTPPQQCTLYLLDDGDSSTCAIYLKGCTPGLREASSIGDDGFSAKLAVGSVSADAQLTQWFDIGPYVDDPAFDAIAGNYTVPETGVYSIKATLNYTMAAPTNASLTGDIDPTFVVRRTSPMATDLLVGAVPILDVNISLTLTFRTLPRNATVTMAGEVELSAGDVIGLFYAADGLSDTLSLAGATNSGSFWSMRRVK